jgi:hypothetical protein
MKRIGYLFLVLAITMVACGGTSPLPEPTQEIKITDTPYVVYYTATAEPVTPSATFTQTLAVTETPAITSTPEISAPTVTVNKQAHCRYGPSAAYLHAADLYAGDKGTVRYRAVYSNWLYVQFEKIS